MIIDKGVVSGEVITLKLTSGEEIIAKLVEETPKGYKISKPLVLSMTQQGIGMMPFIFTANADKDILINYSAVAVVTTTDQQFANQYTQGTTGIAIA
jgi:DhnA family fructose-bisphosphate aldolase class Ia